MKKIAVALLVCLLLGALVYYFLTPSEQLHTGQNRSGARVFLIGIDGGSWDILQRLVTEGKMPHFQKLIQNGAAGNLNSLTWKRMILGGKGYFSPIVWTSIATGKLPDKHGVEDFTLPLPSHLVANLVPDTEKAFATIELPSEIRGRTELIFRARTVPSIPKKKLEISLNSQELEEIELSDQWRVFRVSLPGTKFGATNLITINYSARDSEIGKPVANINFVRVYNPDGQEAADLHFIREKKLYGQGWQIPKTEMVASTSSFHLRTLSLWEILSQNDRRVGVIGWWATWPATKVNGYLLSSHVGHQGARMKGIGRSWLDKLKDVVYPPEYLREVKEDLFLPDTLNAEIVERFYDPHACNCVSKKQFEVFRNFYWQDRFFEKLSVSMLKKHGPFDLFTVYFRGIDTSGHQFLDYAENPESLQSCKNCDPSRLATIVDNYYIYTDQVIGKLQEFADKKTITMIVTDHGQVSLGNKGGHANNGFIVMQGGPIRSHEMKRADVLDIVPTILYALGLPVGLDMDGTVMTEAFDPAYLNKHPMAFINTYDNNSTIIGSKKEMTSEQLDREELEELKALGYIQ